MTCANLHTSGAVHLTGVPLIASFSMYIPFSVFTHKLKSEIFNTLSLFPIRQLLAVKFLWTHFWEDKYSIPRAASRESFINWCSVRCTPCVHKKVRNPPPDIISSTIYIGSVSTFASSILTILGWPNCCRSLASERNRSSSDWYRKSPVFTKTWLPELLIVAE